MNRMLLFDTCKPLFKVFAILTLLAFFPTAAEAWYFLPDRAEKPEQQTENVSTGSPLPSEGVAALTGTPAGEEAVDVSGQTNMTPGRMKIARGDATPEEAANSSEKSASARIRLAANVPSVQEAIAVFLEASHGAAEVSPLKGPEGSADAQAALGEAVALQEKGQLAEAVLEYVSIIDTYRGTHEALEANNAFRDLTQSLWFQDADKAEALFNAVQRKTPKWETLSAEGKYELITFYSVNAICAHAVGRSDTMLAGFKQGHQRTLQFLREHPNTSLAFVLVEDYYEFRKEHAAVYKAVHKADPEWDTSLTAAANDLREFATAKEQSLTRMAANCVLALHASEVLKDQGAALIHCGEALGGVKAGVAKEALADPYVYTWSKANIVCLTGMAFTRLRQYGEALEWLSQPVFGDYPWSDLQLRHGIELEQVRVRQLMHPQDFDGIATAYIEFIKGHPGSSRVPEAFCELGRVFVLAGDYEGAAKIYAQIVQEHPDTSWAHVAKVELEFLSANLLGSQPVVSFGGWVASAAGSGQLCGPVALHRLLASRGIEVPVKEIASLAKADESGVSMQGLIDAAASKGVELQGVEVQEPQILESSWIAHVNGNHFVLATNLADGRIEVTDSDGKRKSLTSEEFRGIWQGRALVAAFPASGYSKLEAAKLKAIRGGSKTDYAKPTHVPRCEDKCKCGPPPGGGGPGAGPGSPPGVPGPRKIGGTNSPSSYTGIQSPGVNPVIYPSSSSLLVKENDLRLNVRGPMSVTFSRAYMNVAGFHNGRFQDTTKPWSNVIGDGWTHSLNVHLVTGTASGGRPQTLVFRNALGSAVAYVYDSTSDGFDVYVCNASYPNCDTSLDVLYRNVSDGTFRLEYPEVATYVFSAPTAISLGFARLESMEDAVGNAISFAYDGAVGVGKLTKVTPPAGDSRYMSFSYAGNLITKAEICNNLTTLTQMEYAYNENDELTKVTDAASLDVTYSYDDDGQGEGMRFIDEITDKAGNVTSLDWEAYIYSASDPQATKITLTNAAGLSTEYSRSPSTSVANVVNKNGTTELTRFVHSPLASNLDKTQYKFYYLSALVSGGYERWSYYYDEHERLTSVEGPGEIEIASYTYTSNGSLSTSTDQAGVQTTYGYAAEGDFYPASTTGPDGTQRGHYYDANGLLTKTTHASVAAAGWQRAYDSYGQMTSTTDPLGNSTTYAYDHMGNMTSVTDPNSNTTYTYYDELGRMTQAVNALNKSTYYYYDGMGCAGCGGSGGQLTKVTDALGNETEYRYDANGNQTKVIDALDRETDYAYDAMNRMTQVTSPSGSGNARSTTYDLLGHVVTKVDFGGGITTAEYDHMGQMTKTGDAVGDIEYTYDSYGNLSMVTDGNSHTTVYDHDGNNRLTCATDAEGKMTWYFYDAQGRKTKVGAGTSGTTDPTEYSYDDTTGQLTKVRYTSGANTYDADYSYDGRGRLTKIADWISSSGLRYGYDAAGRLTCLTDHDDSTLDYTYGAAGNVLTMNDYHGNETIYTYTDTEQVSTITAPGSKTWTYAYNALGQATKVDIPNGMETQYAFDSRNRLTSIEHKDGATVLTGFTYALDSGGNITRTSHQDNAYWTYEYDGRDRLTRSERYDTDAITLLHRFSYTYDDGDNMLTKEVYTAATTTTVTTAMEYNTANELTKQSVDGTDTTFGYDDWGRATAKTDGPHSATYAYCYDDKLCSLTSDFPSEGSVTYEYDGAGKRRERISGGTTTEYRWNEGWNVVNEEDSSGNLTRTYVGRTSAHVDGTDPSTGTWRFYVHDNLGSSRGMYNANKSQYAAMEHTPYGEVYASSGTTSDITRRFTGHDWDVSARIYYAPYRYYIPGSSRWLTRDPFGMVDGPNVYGYLGGRVVGATDPLGLAPEGPYQGPDGTTFDPTSQATCECYEAAQRIRKKINGTRWLPGIERRNDNHMQHCMASCLLKREKGAACAFAGGWGREIGQIWSGGASWQDTRSNKQGRKCAATASSCRACCRYTINNPL